MSKKMNYQSIYSSNGFTLVEMMITISIIGILSSIALSAYSSYLIKAQVSEGLTLTLAAKTAVSEFYTQNGFLPTGNTIAGIAPPSSISGSYVNSVTVTASGIISVDFGNDANVAINARQLELSPITSSSSLLWVCASPNIQDRYLPVSCK